MHDVTQDLRKQAQPQQRAENIINGKIVAGDHTLAVYDPSMNKQISTLYEADATIVDRAVTAAKSSFEGGHWRLKKIEERQIILRRVAERVSELAPELASLESLNTGIPRAHLLAGQIARVALNFRFFADFIGQSSGEVYTQNTDYLTFVRRDPVGVAALIGPWNAPLALTTMKLAAALAFGNSCVVKASELTPLSILKLMPILHEAGIPEGVVNIVNGRGAVTGAALCQHRDINRISFTGGTATGRQILSLAADNLTPVTMELGGKSANIIFETADIERAVDGALLGIFSNNGQQCLAGSRILVQKSIAEPFIDALVRRTNNIRVGDPFDPATEIGALGSRAHRDKVLAYTDIGKAAGGQLLTGGTSISELEPGAYMRPTLMQVSDNNNRLCQEEIFGPFGVIQSFETKQQAWQIANDTRFGLVSYVWSEDLATIMEAQRMLQSGLVWVNTPMVRELRAPFGGVKDSGIGREGGQACEQFYTEEKTVTIPQTKLPLSQLGKL